MKRARTDRVSAAPGGHSPAGERPEVSDFSGILLLIGFTLFGMALGSMISQSLWAGPNHREAPPPAAEDSPLAVPAATEKKPQPRQDDLVFHAPGIEVTIEEPLFPVSAEVERGMSAEDVLTTYGQPNLTITQVEHNQTIQRLEYVDSDLHTTSILLRRGLVVDAAAAAVRAAGER